MSPISLSQLNSGEYDCWSLISKFHATHHKFPYHNFETKKHVSPNTCQKWHMTQNVHNQSDSLSVQAALRNSQP